MNNQIMLLDGYCKYTGNICNYIIIKINEDTVDVEIQSKYEDKNPVSFTYLYNDLMYIMIQDDVDFNKYEYVDESTGITLQDNIIDFTTKNKKY